MKSCAVCCHHSAQSKLTNMRSSKAWPLAWQRFLLPLGQGFSTSRKTQIIKQSHQLAKATYTCTPAWCPLGINEGRLAD